MGESIYKETEKMRKVNFDPLSQAIRKTSSCFEARKDTISLEKAKSQLVVLRNSDLFEHLSSDEKNEVVTAIDRFN